MNPRATTRSARGAKAAEKDVRRILTRFEHIGIFFLPLSLSDSRDDVKHGNKGVYDNGTRNAFDASRERPKGRCLPACGARRVTEATGAAAVDRDSAPDRTN